jgi:hypothetical protein
MKSIDDKVDAAGIRGQGTDTHALIMYRHLRIPSKPGEPIYYTSKAWCPYCIKHHNHGYAKGNAVAHCGGRPTPFRKTINVGGESLWGGGYYLIEAGDNPITDGWNPRKDYWLRADRTPRDTPVLEALPIDIEGNLAAWCPHCMEWHEHNRGEGRKLVKCKESSRSPFLLTGYYLRVMDGNFRYEAKWEPGWESNAWAGWEILLPEESAAAKAGERLALRDWKWRQKEMRRLQREDLRQR